MDSRPAGMLPAEYDRRLQHWLWQRAPRTRAGRAVRALARYAWALTRDLAAGDIGLRAMSLVYTSLLSLVPFLALAFSLLKAFGVHNSLEPFLANFFAPLGDRAPELTSRVIGFVDNIKVGVLGSVGVGLLLYTAISLVHKVESSFNVLWEVPKTRGLPQRFSEYLSMLLIAPVLGFSALSLAAGVMNSRVVERLGAIAPIGFAVWLAAHLLPYAFMVAAFTFTYGFVPNARVRLRAALCGGLFAAVVWQGASAVFAAFVARAGNYNAIYSGFAIVIFVLIWLHVSWLILLLGCRLAFYVQSPHRLRMPLAAAVDAGSREHEALALALTLIVVQRFVAAAAALTPGELAAQLGVPLPRLRHALDTLMAAGTLALDASGAVLPARDPAGLPLAELWRQARGAYAEMPATALARGQACLQVLEQQAADKLSLNVRDWALAAAAETNRPLQEQGSENNRSVGTAVSREAAWGYFTGPSGDH